MDKSDELKMLVDTISAAESRRQFAATAHITATAVVAAILTSLGNYSLFLPPLIMLFISVSWLSNTVSFNRLLRAKWHVAEQLQEGLGIRTFIDEKNHLSSNKGFLSTSISKSEYLLPALIVIGSTLNLLFLVAERLL